MFLLDREGLSELEFGPLLEPNGYSSDLTPGEPGSSPEWHLA